MKPYRATASALVEAPAEQVYALLADYRNGHPRILPKPYFGPLEVEQGGVGAGTIIRFQMHVLGKTQDFRAAITEPEPGRQLVESYLEPDGLVTRFTVVPDEQGAQTRVTISTEGRTRSAGMPGWLERFLTVMLLQRIFRKELRLLAALAEGCSSGSPGTASP